MTKKILALALAGTTAFSVFGGLNVFAAAEYDAYKPYEAYDISSVTVDQGNAEEIAGAFTSATTGINGEEIYKYDYFFGDAKVNDAINGALDGSVTDEDVTALQAILDAAKAYTGMDAAGTDETKASSARISAYNAVVELQDTMAEVETAMGDSDDWTNYNLAALKTAIDGVDADKLTSEYYALKEAYDYYDEMFGFSSIAANNYADALEKVEAYEPDDYTDSKWALVQDYIQTAKDYAAEDNYKKAMEYIDKAKGVSFKTPDKSELKSLLASLFTDGKITATYSGKGTCIYVKKDYNTSAKDDAWDVFAEGYTDVDGKAIEAVYTTAYKAYRATNKRQSEINTVITNLEEAVASLDVTSSAKDWMLLQLEGMVEEAEGLVESDYRETTSTYKAFVKALENAQRVLAKANPGKSEVTAAVNNLKPYIEGDGLTPVTKSNTTARNNLKKAIKAAKAVDTTGMSDAQILAVKNAIAAAEATANNTKLLTISSMTNAQEALEEALALSAQPQGWYTNAAGKWMYGEGETYVTNGWKKIANCWYYFNADGTAKQNEWFKDGNDWFWLTNNCNAAHGWYKINGDWYFFRDGGYMVTGWRMVNGNWYYMDASGKMMTGWVNVGGKSYYLSKEAYNYGAMLANTTTPDGYKVGADGAWIK